MKYANEDGLKVGWMLKDNDPRMSHRRALEIVTVYPFGVDARDSLGRVRTYLNHRIHQDSKPRKSGLSVIKTNPQPVD